MNDNQNTNNRNIDDSDQTIGDEQGSPPTTQQLTARLTYLFILLKRGDAWLRQGSIVPSPEVVNNASFIIIFPLTFVANTFVPLATLPGPLQTFAEWNPVSAVTQAARELFGNTDPSVVAQPGTDVSTSWALQNPELYTLIWAAAVLVVFVPLANWQYRRSTSR